MTKIFKYLKDSKAMVLTIILLLVIQAGCELSLPQYTSDIVDIGIQQGGIERVTPEVMRKETYQNLTLFMTEEEIQKVEPYYSENEEGNYVLNTEDEDVLEEMDQALGMPMLILASLEENAEVDINQIRQAFEAGMVTGEQMLEQRNEVEAALGDMSESIIQQKAILLVQEEYEAVGLDLDQLQMDYLKDKGVQMIGMAVMMMVASVLVALLAAKVAAGVGRDLRRKVFQKVVSFSNAEMEHFSTASLITRSTNDIQQIQMVEVMLLRMVCYAPIIGLGGIFKVINTKTGMSWIIVVAVAAIMVLVLLLMTVAMPKFKQMQTLVDRLNLVSREILTGIPVIRAFSREKFEEKRFDVANTNLMKTQLFTNRVMTIMMPAMMLIMNGITVLIVWSGAHGIDQGNLQVGDMMAFITYTMQIVMSFLMLTMISIMLPRAGVAADRIEEVLQMEVSVKDAENVRDAELDDVKGYVEFKDVSFRYPGADEETLEHISFVAKPGETTAIIGSTGSGKSTLVKLVPRFFDVTGGAITIDGIDIRELSMNKVRSILGLVPQKGVLFSGTIESNLKFGGEWITDEAMETAAEVAQATEFIETKKDRYQSPIAQGGTNVSGGQKQRLSIARAIAKNPKVFLFDDSFSALDYKTDVVLRRALNEKVGDATVIIVAQRISTILHADQIIVLEDGHVAGIGRHEELLESCEAYQEIAKSQLSESELKGGHVS
ncbi:ABC transporter ATP-binding protein [Frisingicoccus sp.]|uniref:ABC transporter ATP-binding protein n=1 Tax=Frisingicoccus sp. TaxID=1918627 RepID=UPI002EAAFC41|nr:ABC transporter ATP-binding protein [Frisingicoccus sp.]